MKLNIYNLSKLTLAFIARCCRNSAIVKWWQSLRYYVIADPNDNSITLSKALFNHIKHNAKQGEVAQVFVFRIAHNARYGFMTNPDIEQPTQLCDIQYNDKYHCIGFESLCPSVGQIFYSYGLDFSPRVKLSVSVQRTEQGKIFYQLQRPRKSCKVS